MKNIDPEFQNFKFEFSNCVLKTNNGIGKLATILRSNALMTQFQKMSNDILIVFNKKSHPINQCIRTDSLLTDQRLSTSLNFVNVDHT